MANIFFLTDVCKFFKVNMDSSIKHAMYVYYEGDLVMEFKDHKSDLYFFNVAKQCNTNLSSDIN